MKNLKPYFGAAAALIFSVAAQAKTIEIQQMRQILPAVTANTMVIFDIDNTILRPAQTLGSDQWYGYEVKRLTSTGMPEDRAISIAIAAWMNVQTKTAVLPVEAATPQLIQFLQKNHVPVM